MRVSLALSILFLFSVPAKARVFDFKGESAAAYLRGTYGTIALGKQAFADSGGASLTFNETSQYGYTGELGFAFTVKAVTLRLGFEVLRPQSFNGVEAKDAAGTIQYNLNTSVIGGGGIVNLDFLFAQGARSRFYVTLGGAYSKLTIRNEYIFTDAGATTYATPSYTEEGSAYAMSMMAGLGWEAAMADSVTFSLDTGYRSLIATGFKHERQSQTVMGNVAVGDSMRNRDGTDRKLDLSGFWVGAGFRFYIKFL